MSQFSRRNFLQLGTAAAITSGRHFTLAAQQLESIAGDRVRFASIGVGIQGSSLLRAAMTLPQAQCVAACDLYDGRHTLAREIAGQSIRTTRKYHEILDDPAYTEKRVDVLWARGEQAWREYVPISQRRDGKVYSQFSFGPLLDVFVLDMRTYRDANPWGWAGGGVRPDGGILGTEQAQWLVEAMAASTARWKVLTVDQRISSRSKSRLVSAMVEIRASKMSATAPWMVWSSGVIRGSASSSAGR